MQDLSFPNQGLNPCPLQWKCRVCTTGLPGKFPSSSSDRASSVVSGLPRGLSGKESACQCKRLRFGPWVGKSPWERKWQSAPGFLPEKFHGQRSLVGYSPWGRRVRHELSTHARFWGLYVSFPQGSLSSHHRLLSLLPSHFVKYLGKKKNPRTHLYQFAKAAVTKYYRRSGLNNRNSFLTILKARSLRSRCQQGWFLFFPFFLVMPHAACGTLVP